MANERLDISGSGIHLVCGSLSVALALVRNPVVYAPNTFAPPDILDSVTTFVAKKQTVDSVVEYLLKNLLYSVMQQCKVPQIPGRRRP